jgi:hypothetical protein
MCAHAVSHDAMVAIGRHLEELLPVRSIVRSGEDGGTSAIYLLMGLHAPSLCEIADGAGPVDPQSVVSHETYLRIPFSPFDRLVTIQEVRVHARWTPEDALSIVEEPMGGVVDGRLRGAIKGLQGALRKAGLTLLDMAFLDEKPAARPQTAYEAQFGEEPTLWSLLFDPAPATMMRASLVPA